MEFRSDNAVGAHPAVLEALARANAGSARAYGEDELTRALERRVSELFERDCAVFPVATGTAANALALAALCPPWGAVYCHEEAHIAEDECGAPEFFAGGARLERLPGAHGKLAAAELEAALRQAPVGVQHSIQPAAVSLTQASEAGTVYRPDEIAAIAAIAHGRGLRLHMDGARFANALAALGCTPAEATWRAGLDALSFGATKNGALAAEAVVFFDRALAADFPYRRKRGGHLVSKMRFVSAQLMALLEDGLWLANARHANRMARHLADGLAGCEILHPVEANELFVRLPEATVAALEAQGFRFYRWDGSLLRLVTSFATRPEEVDAFVAAAKALA